MLLRFQALQEEAGTRTSGYNKHPGVTLAGVVLHFCYHPVLAEALLQTKSQGPNFLLQGHQTPLVSWVK